MKHALYNCRKSSEIIKTSNLFPFPHTNFEEKISYTQKYKQRVRNSFRMREMNTCHLLHGHRHTFQQPTELCGILNSYHRNFFPHSVVPSLFIHVSLCIHIYFLGWCISFTSALMSAVFFQSALLLVIFSKLFFAVWIV